MKVLGYVTTILLSLAVLTGCDDKVEEPAFTVDFEIDDSKVAGGELVITDAVYNNNVILAANTNGWDVDVSQTGKWLTVTKLSDGDSHRVNIKAEENAGFDSRKAEISFKYQGRQVGGFKVKQLGSGVVFEVAEDDLTQSLGFEESVFDVVIRTNTDGYTVTYEYEQDGDKDWIVPVEGDAGDGTRAVESASKTLKFKALTNGFDTRRGKIVFTLGDIERKVAVNQLGETPDIIVDETAVALLYNTASLEIDVTSNVLYNVDVVYTDGNGWLTKAPGTRALTASKAKFTVSRNETASPRSAAVVFTYKDAGKGVDIRKEVPVTQGGIAMSVSDPSDGSLELPFAGSTFTVKVASNTDTAPAATTPAWITQQGEPSFAGGIYTYTFSFGDNNTTSELTGKIVFTVYSIEAEVDVTQITGAIYQDMIPVVGATATQQSGTYSGIERIFNGNISDNWDSNYSDSAKGETVTLTFQLGDGAGPLSSVVYYRKGNNDTNAFSMTGFELLTSDTADGGYISRGTYTVSPAPAKEEPYTVALNEPVQNPKYVRMVCTVPANGWFTCAEMQFFATSVQNDEHFSGSLSNTNTTVDVNTIVSAGGTLTLTAQTNSAVNLEFSSWLTVSEKPVTRALPERSEKSWTISAGPNTSSLSRTGYVKVKRADGTVMRTYTVNQLGDASRITATARESEAGLDISKALNNQYAGGDEVGIWESSWSGTVTDANPVWVSFKLDDAPAKLSGITIIPRDGNGDWLTFTVTVKTASGETVVHTQDNLRQRTRLDITGNLPIENPTEVYINILKTTGGTGTLKHIMFW